MCKRNFVEIKKPKSWSTSYENLKVKQWLGKAKLKDEETATAVQCPAYFTIFLTLLIMTHNTLKKQGERACCCSMDHECNIPFLSRAQCVKSTSVLAAALFSL